MDEQIHKELVEAVNAYNTPQNAVALLTAHPPLIFTGITAAGKDAVADYIEQSSPWRRIVTHTTRAMRPGDKNGVHQWFVTEPEMLALIKQDAFIETKMVHSPQCKGSSIAAYRKVIDDSKEPIMRIDIQGIEEVMKHVPNLNPVFILPPSFEVWMERLGSRGPMSHVEKLRRLKSAQDEIEAVLASNHFRLVVNNEIPALAHEILAGTTDRPTQHRNLELARDLLSHIITYQ